MKIGNLRFMTFDRAFDVIKNKKLAQKPIQAAWICNIAQKEVDRIFKEKDIFVASFKNQTLNIRVPNSALAGEVRLQSEELKNNINQKFRPKADQPMAGNKELVEKIRTKIG